MTTVNNAELFVVPVSIAKDTANSSTQQCLLQQVGAQTGRHQHTVTCEDRKSILECTTTWVFHVTLVNYYIINSHMHVRMLEQL